MCELKLLSSVGRRIWGRCGRFTSDYDVYVIIDHILFLPY